MKHPNEKRKKPGRGFRWLISLLTLLLLTGCGAENISDLIPQTAETAAPKTAAEQSAQSGQAGENNAAELYLYYARLDEGAKLAYDELIDHIEQADTAYVPQSVYTWDQLTAAFDAVYNEHPELFWVENLGTCTNDGGSGYMVEVTLTYNSLADNLEGNRAAFDAAEEAALAGLDGMTDAEKEKAIHDYLVEHVTYEHSDLDQTAYGALVNGSCVCNGFAQAFQYLMRCEQIPAYYVYGQGCDADTGWDTHAWNIVKLGDGYYNVDVTFDNRTDEGNCIYYDYYNCTDAEFAADHIRDEGCAFLPACDASEYSYEAQYGLPGAAAAAEQLGLTDETIITSAEQYCTVMETALTDAGLGTHTFSYVLSGDECVSAVSAIYDSTDSIEGSFLGAVIEAHSLESYSWQVTDISWQELGQSYYYFTATFTLENTGAP